VSDSKTGIYKEDGLPIEDLILWKKDKKSFADREEEKISNKDLLELEVDLLIPSALGGVITEKNVENIKARVIVEMANAPISPEADSVLLNKDIEIIPDILVNSGGVIVSYFEWKQNKEEEQWTARKVQTKLEEKIKDSYTKVLKEYKENKHADLRRASYVLAIKRILDAEK